MMDEDGGDGSMVCTDHPFKNSSPGGGICAFCLQEKLGKLVSSSFPIAVFPASSSSESPSFRSASDQTTTSISLSNPTTAGPHHHSTTINNDSNRSKILYLLSSSSTHQKNKKKKNMDNNLVFKRSKSTAIPRKPRFMDTISNDSTSKRGFWSFLYLSKQSQSTRKTSSTTSTSFQRSRQNVETKEEDVIVVEENNEMSPSYDRRKVSRSRSVGCGSRSFSGDFFERISTGFGDCTLRRVESQREGKPKVSSSSVVVGGNDCIIKERVRCGGLFSGFMITSSSSSNSSSSSYWLASNPNNIKPPSAVGGGGGGVQHSRSKSWGWGLASPMRAFNKHSSSKREKQQNPTPNLAAIPSLLSVRS